MVLPTLNEKVSKFTPISYSLDIHKALDIPDSQSERTISITGEQNKA